MCVRFIFTSKIGYNFEMKRRIKIQQFGQISAKMVQGLETWSSKCMHNSPKFSYREKRKNRISTLMRLVVTPRHQANRMLINKRKYQFAWTIVVWQVTRNRQIFTAVETILLRKSRLQDQSNNIFLEVSKCRIIWLTSQIAQITRSNENMFSWWLYL